MHALGYHIAIGKTVTESQAQEYMSMQTPALVSAEETHCCWQVHLSSPHAPVISSSLHRICAAFAAYLLLQWLRQMVIATPNTNGTQHQLVPERNSCFMAMAM